MSVDVSVQVAKPRMLAAVRRQVLVGQVGTAWRPTLDRVREFLSHHPGLCADGHNVFLYHHPAARHLPMEVNFGVEIVRPFEEAGEVHLVETPGGKVASALHVGPYDRMRETHDAIHRWAAAMGRALRGSRGRSTAIGPMM
jgi:effector-binding domain-containing protein